ncbi:hypothetical protein A0H81_14770 [Grifola frondosa]|uniref:Uncharacterized protein n=1 Tax=Grifola frondosa TaxID=5627 RepID=A0A1C7LMQ4_GRIFR|nr:hypothetical protein A0H81_14770 [Grifola frondosa]
MIFGEALSVRSWRAMSETIHPAFAHLLPRYRPSSLSISGQSPRSRIFAGVKSENRPVFAAPEILLSQSRIDVAPDLVPDGLCTGILAFILLSNRSHDAPLRVGRCHHAMSSRNTSELPLDLILLQQERLSNTRAQLQNCKQQNEALVNNIATIQEKLELAEKKVAALEVKLAQRDSQVQRAQIELKENRTTAEKRVAQIQMGKDNAEKRLADTVKQLQNATGQVDAMEAQLQTIEKQLIAALEEKVDADKRLLDDCLLENKRLKKQTSSSVEKFDEFQRSISMGALFSAPNWKTSTALFHGVDYCDHDEDLVLPNQIRQLCAADGVIYAPGCTKICAETPKVAFVVYPTYTYRSRKPHYFERHSLPAEFRGQTRELFHNYHGKIYYVGTYKCLDGSGLLTEQKMTKHVMSMLNDVVRITMLQCNRILRPLFEDGFQKGILTVNIMGLRCVGFNKKLYDALLAIPRSAELKRKNEDSTDSGSEATEDSGVKRVKASV